MAGWRRPVEHDSCLECLEGWYNRVGLNHRPLDPQSNALPTELRLHVRNGLGLFIRPTRERCTISLTENVWPRTSQPPQAALPSTRPWICNNASPSTKHNDETALSIVTQRRGGADKVFGGVLQRMHDVLAMFYDLTC